MTDVKNATTDIEKLNFEISEYTREIDLLKRKKKSKKFGCFG